MARFALLFGLLVPLIQVACAVHAYKNGKDRFWFWVILLFPMIGSAVYFISEVVPVWRRTGELLRWVEGIPWFRGRELARLEDELEYAPTIDNRLNLAAACVRHGRLERAVELYQECLKGVHKNDVPTMRSLAEALMEKEDWKDLLEIATDLRTLLPERDLNEAIRYEAIALDGMERSAEAEERYLHLLDVWPGEEIRCRLGTLLARHGRHMEARKHLETVQRYLRRGNSYYRRQNKAWSNSSAAWLKFLDQQQQAKSA